MLEVLFTCRDNDGKVVCSAYDFRTGTNLMTYKGGGTANQRTFCIAGSEHVIVGDSTKPLIHVWPINSQQEISSVRFVTPGVVSALALTPDSNYLVAGIQENLYIWHIRTGRLLKSVAKHYQKVNCIKFTDDGSHFISAGQDGTVFVWNLTQLVGYGDDNQTPLYNFNDHGLPVMDIHVGAGGMRAYMMTVSLDCSCKVYDLSNGIMLLNLVFTEPLFCVTANLLENRIYVGTGKGNIYEFHIDSAPRTKEYHVEKGKSNKFVKHTAAVICLVLSLDGHTMLSGGQDGDLCIWHVPSKQLLKTMSHKGAINNIHLLLTNLSTFHAGRTFPCAFGNNLQRMITSPQTDDDEIINVLVTDDMEENWANEVYNGIQLAAVSCDTTSRSTNSKKAAEEIDELHNEVQRLKHINHQLFKISSKAILRQQRK